MSRLIIEPGNAERNYWHDLWRYRELFYVLAWRDISVRYKQTALGVLWAILQPLVLTMVGTFIGKMANFGTEDVPRPLWIFAATMPWQFFSASLNAGGQSMITNSNLISKVYFPRLIIPASAVVTAMVDFLIMFGMFLVMMAWYQVWPTWRFAFLPVLAVLAFLTALGPGLLITALNVKYRDFRYVIPFAVQAGFYLSPILYSRLDFIKNHPALGWLYSVNPMAGVIDAFRWALLGGKGGLTVDSLVWSIAITIFFLVAGTWYFRKTERIFADVV